MELRYSRMGMLSEAMLIVERRLSKSGGVRWLVVEVGMGGVLAEKQVNLIWQIACGGRGGLVFE